MVRNLYRKSPNCDETPNFLPENLPVGSRHYARLISDVVKRLFSSFLKRTLCLRILSICLPRDVLFPKPWKLNFCNFLSVFSPSFLPHKSLTENSPGEGRPSSKTSRFFPRNPPENSPDGSKICAKMVRNLYHFSILTEPSRQQKQIHIFLFDGR